MSDTVILALIPAVLTLLLAVIAVLRTAKGGPPVSPGTVARSSPLSLRSRPVTK